MFTGLVSEIGRLIEEPRPSSDGGRRFVVGLSPALTERLKIGDSLAIAGVCLTLTESGSEHCVVEAGPETLRRTTLGKLLLGSPVNLEPALRMGDPLGGHWVQGHVDGVLEVVHRRDQLGHRELGFSLPDEYQSFVVEKGSVTIDGTSLTVSKLDASHFEVALIPHTLAATTLGDLVDGDQVNYEADVLAKYVQRALLTTGSAPS